LDRFAVCAVIDGCGPHQRRPERAVGHSTRCVDVPVAEDFSTDLFRLPALLGLQHRLLGKPFKQRIEIGLHLARNLLGMPVPEVNDEPLGSLNKLRRQPRIPAGSSGVRLTNRCVQPSDGSSRFPFCYVEWHGQNGWVSLNGLE
jgi:hypothetical protein